MEAVFLKLVNMSLTANWLVLAVILLRLILKKAPKFISCILWALVGIRLILPFSLESILSLIPSSQPIPDEFITTPAPSIQSGITYVDNVINPIISQSLAPQIGADVNPTQVLSLVATVVWILGVVGMIAYTVISYLRIHSRVREATPFRENILICDRIDTPFILGVINPKIYLPSNMNETDMDYVIAHEKAHLRRGDHLWKPLGFVLLTVYWFNPILWVAYVLLCRDIEFACDEKVIKQLGNEIKKPYSDALINSSVKRKMISACPLAFGEVGVKNRIKSVLNYKKPAFWIIIVAVVLSIIAAVCFLTNPLQAGISSIKVTQEHSGKSFLVIDYSDISAYEAANGTDLIPIGENGGFVEELGKYHISVVALDGKLSEKLLKTYPTGKVHKLKNSPDGYNIMINYAEFSDLPMESAVYIYIGSDSPISCVPGGKKEGELRSRGQIKIEIQTGTSESFQSAVAYVNYSDSTDLKEKSLNASVLSDTFVQHYPIRRFDSKEQLNKFKTDFTNELSFNQKHDECPSFNEVTAKYNDSFFKDKVLFGVYIPSGSGSYRFGVHRVYNNGKSFTVIIKQLNDPEVVTMDMAGWMAFVEVDRAAVKDCTAFDAIKYSEIFTKDPNSSSTIVDSSLFTDEFDVGRTFVSENISLYFARQGNKVGVKIDDTTGVFEWQHNITDRASHLLTAQPLDVDRNGTKEAVIILPTQDIDHIVVTELHLINNKNGALTDVKFQKDDCVSQLEKALQYVHDDVEKTLTLTVSGKSETYDVSNMGEFEYISLNDFLIFSIEQSKIYVTCQVGYRFSKFDSPKYIGGAIQAEVAYDEANGFVMKNFTLHRDNLYDIPTTAPTTTPTTQTSVKPTTAPVTKNFDNVLGFKDNKLTLNGRTYKFTDSQKSTSYVINSKIALDVYKNSSLKVEFYAGTTTLKEFFFWGDYKPTTTKIYSKEELYKKAYEAVSNFFPYISEYEFGTVRESGDTDYIFSWHKYINGMPTGDIVQLHISQHGDLLSFVAPENQQYKKYRAAFEKVDIAQYKENLAREFEEQEAPLKDNPHGYYKTEILSDGVLTLNDDYPCVAFLTQSKHIYSHEERMGIIKYIPIEVQ